jgi:hypothetical protein
MKRILKNYPSLLLFGAFGPYISISLGVKLDNAIVYSVGILLILLILTKEDIEIHRNLFRIMIAWVVLFIFLFIRTIFGGESMTSSFIAEIKNFTQPFFIMLFFVFVFYKHDKYSIDKLLIKTGRVLLFLLSINTLWIFLGFFKDLTPINEYFWRGDNSVALNAAQNGRFSGIFNQPIEAGMAYSTGLYVWAYLIHKTRLKIKVKDIMVVTFLLIGGAMSVSKVFLLFGSSLFIFYILSLKQIRRQLIKIGIFFFVIITPVFYYLTSTWSGLNYLLRLFKSDNYQQQGFLTFITAGRYGSEESQQNQLFKSILDKSPLFGEGLGSQETYDSAFFHLFSSGGFIALFLYITVLIVLLWSVYEFYVFARKSPEFKLFFCLFLLTVIGGLGAPVLTLNRSSVILWVFIGLTLQSLSVCVKEKGNKTNQEKEVLAPVKETTIKLH